MSLDIYNDEEIQRPRTPREFRSFIQRIHSSASEAKDERHKGLQKKGPYKLYLDELVPLSYFATERYSEEFRIQPVVGNQRFDARVLDRDDNVVDKIEITSPHNGKERAKEGRDVVTRGHGDLRSYSPGEEIAELSNFILQTAKDKAKKDYSDCILLFVMRLLPPVDSFRDAADREISVVAERLRQIPFQAKEVLLLELPVAGPARLKSIQPKRTGSE